MRTCCIALLFVFCTIQLYANNSDTTYYIGMSGNELANANVRTAKVNTLDQYKGYYHFGESEGEWTLQIFKKPNGTWDARAYSSAWDINNNSTTTLVSIVSYFDEVHISKAKIVLDGTEYRLCEAKNTDDILPWAKENTLTGLLLCSVIDGKMECEFGYRDDESGDSDYDACSNCRHVYGRFTEASTQLLSKEELKNTSKKDLRLMRNEVYARYGYIFKTKDLDTYFRSKEWYTPCCTDVKDKITKTEQKNIDLLLKLENQQ